jgi:hypothetical protein
LFCLVVYLLGVIPIVLLPPHICHLVALLCVALLSCCPIVLLYITSLSSCCPIVSPSSCCPVASLPSCCLLVTVIPVTSPPLCCPVVSLLSWVLSLHQATSTPHPPCEQLQQCRVVMVIGWLCWLSGGWVLGLLAMTWQGLCPPSIVVIHAIHSTCYSPLWAVACSSRVRCWVHVVMFIISGRLSMRCKVYGVGGLPCGYTTAWASRHLPGVIPALENGRGIPRGVPLAFPIQPQMNPHTCVELVMLAVTWQVHIMDCRIKGVGPPSHHRCHHAVISTCYLALRAVAHSGRGGCWVCSWFWGWSVVTWKFMGVGAYLAGTLLRGPPGTFLVIPAQTSPLHRIRLDGGEGGWHELSLQKEVIA